MIHFDLIKTILPWPVPPGIEQDQILMLGPEEEKNMWRMSKPDIRPFKSVTRPDIKLSIRRMDIWPDILYPVRYLTDKNKKKGKIFL